MQQSRHACTLLARLHTLPGARSPLYRCVYALVGITFEWKKVHPRGALFALCVCSKTDRERARKIIKVHCSHRVWWIIKLWCTLLRATAQSFICRRALAFYDCMLSIKCNKHRMAPFACRRRHTRRERSVRSHTMPKLVRKRLKWRIILKKVLTGCCQETMQEAKLRWVLLVHHKRDQKAAGEFNIWNTKAFLQIRLQPKFAVPKYQDLEKNYGNGTTNNVTVSKTEYGRASKLSI